MPLDPFAMLAGKRSEVLAGIARLDGHQLHRRTASRALKTFVLCVEHGGIPLVGRSKFAGKPTGRCRFERIGCNDAYLNVIALWAFEQPVFEPDWPCGQYCSVTV